MSLENRILVLKKDGSNLQLPAKNYLAVKAPDGILLGHYSSFRVMNFNENTGELILHHEKVGRLDEKSFNISMETNSAALDNQNIKAIIIAEKHSASYITPRDFNNDIKSDQRLYPQMSYKDSKPFSEEKETQVKIDQSIYCPINELTFEDGLVSFSYYIDKKLGARKFEITNAFLKKEFDSIKNYFEKALNLKRISIHIKLEAIQLEIKEQSAFSSDIERINAEIIELVENYVIDESLLISENEIEKFKIKEEEISNILGINLTEKEDWLWNKIIVPNRTKHYYHLRYLSSKQAAHIVNLRFSSSPKSFIFLIENENSFFLIWETYETNEATYMWKLESNKEDQLQIEIESLVTKIKLLKKGNKRAFLNSKPINFKKIEHEYNHEDFGFNKWEVQFRNFVGMSSY